MARKPASNDMAEHERTYAGFLALTKFSIIALVIVMIALYCLIVASQTILGWILLIAAVPVAIFFYRKPNAAS